MLVPPDLWAHADLLPADITGSFVYDQREGRFDFRPYSVFTNAAG